MEMDFEKIERELSEGLAQHQLYVSFGQANEDGPARRHQVPPDFWLMLYGLLENPSAGEDLFGQCDFQVTLIDLEGPTLLTDKMFNVYRVSAKVFHRVYGLLASFRAASEPLG
jgi:hypothetical protein